MTRITRLLNKVLVCIPTLGRPELIKEAVAQYPPEVRIFVAEEGFERNYYSSQLNVMSELFEPSPGVHEQRNAAFRLAHFTGRQYILQVDDDTFWPGDIRKSIATLVADLGKHMKLWAVGGQGQFNASWAKKLCDGVYLTAQVSPGWAMMMRRDVPIRFRVPYMEDTVFCMDTWGLDRWIARDARVVTDHRWQNKGGFSARYQEDGVIGDTGKTYKLFTPEWTAKYRPVLEKARGNNPYVNVTKTGRVRVNFKKLGIKTRCLE